MAYKHRTLLIIDDNEDVSMIMALTLGNYGFTILEAADGEIGCRMAIEVLPCLILCDDQMPNLNGAQTLARLKDTPATLNIPVLMFGGDGLQNEAIWRSRGACGFIAKPFQMTELRGKVDSILSKVGGA